MTNNTTLSDVISLFPDNTDNSISAADMRTSWNATYLDSEVKIVKIPNLSELPLQTNIYEGSLVVVFQTDIGLYLSKINQPQNVGDLIKIT